MVPASMESFDRKSIAMDLFSDVNLLQRENYSFFPTKEERKREK